MNRLSLAKAIFATFFMAGLGACTTSHEGLFLPETLGGAPVTVSVREQIEPGVEYLKLTISEGTTSGEWRLRSGPLIGHEALEEVTACLLSLGIEPWTKRSFQLGGPVNAAYVIVYSDALPSEAEAVATRQAWSQTGCDFHVQDMAFEPGSGPAPLSINLLVVDPDEFDGTIEIALADDTVAGRAKTSLVARQSKAVAAINGSFFVEYARDGLPGDVAGLLVLDGEIVSEGINGRPAFIVEQRSETPFRIDVIEPAVWIEDETGSRLRIDGINRPLGQTRNCGNIGDTPTELAVHDETCRDDGEIIAFTSHAGFLPSLDARSVAFIDSRGYRADADELPDLDGGAFILVASGDRQAELSDALARNLRLTLVGDPALQRTGVYALNGAPTLLLNGKRVYSEQTEGWPLSADASAARADAVHRWINLRNPRTAIGITDAGHLLLLTIDGRQRAVSVGATIEELRDLIASLGATDALNLDGGGSTTLAIGATIVNAPSDRAGERPVADAIILRR